MSMPLSHRPSPPQSTPSPPSLPSPQTTNPPSPTVTPKQKTIIPTATGAPTKTVQPSAAPTTTPQPSISRAPMIAGQLSVAPSPSSTTLPSMVPSCNPSSEPTPTLFQQDVVFACTPEGIVDLAQPPFDAVTIIQFKVGYLVESLAPLLYIDDLERQILATAVAGALQCNEGGPLFGTVGLVSIGRSTELAPNIQMNTTGTGESCESSVSVCTALATEFQVAVNEELDPEVAAFLGYVLLREKMDDGTFVDAIPGIDRCQYLSPLPLLPPIVGDDDVGPDSPPSVEAEERVSVSPWTLSAVSAMCKSP
jgi:hypothetical protein